jgi:hypothetical protein
METRMKHRLGLYCATVLGIAGAVAPAMASDHLDSPTVIADPAADIGDLYGWMSPDGRRLNLVMTIVGKQFSDRIAYVFHIDSGQRFGDTRAVTAIDCRFSAQGEIRCVGADDRVMGLAGRPEGIESVQGRFRVFAGLRDDPFANNVRGTRQAYEVARTALEAGVGHDAAGCPAFDGAVARDILDRWRHTDGGPARNFLAGWQTGALVVSIDVQAVSAGGPLLAVWAGTYAPDDIAGHDGIDPDTRVDRVGRTLTGNALLGPLESSEVVEPRKERYNRAAQTGWEEFAPYIRRTLGLYDAFDGVCGNQWLAAPRAEADRYLALARLLADDRLWIDSRYGQCQRYMAVETGDSARYADCGGRTPDSDAIEVYRSLLVNGTVSGVDDGVSQDDKPVSTVDFPFLAEP